NNQILIGFDLCCHWIFKIAILFSINFTKRCASPLRGSSIHKGCDLFYLYDLKMFNYVSALLLGNSHNEIEDYCGARHI
ncbi:hypothetical protein CWN39_25835, partial [Klebsiella pneumoniae]